MGKLYSRSFWNSSIGWLFFILKAFDFDLQSRKKWINSQIGRVVGSMKALMEAESYTEDCIDIRKLAWEARSACNSSRDCVEFHVHNVVSCFRGGDRGHEAARRGWGWTRRNGRSGRLALLKRVWPRVERGRGPVSMEVWGTVFSSPGDVAPVGERVETSRWLLPRRPLRQKNRINWLKGLIKKAE
nr:probable serine/threonine-protein kinase DDB_G0277165 [Ipomoea batatas]